MFPSVRSLAAAAAALLALPTLSAAETVKIGAAFSLKAGIVHCTIGKASFDAKALRENLLALIADIQMHKPSTSKGVFLQRVSVSSTMGPGVAVDRASLGV